MKYNNEPLSVEDRERILTELHQREFLEKQAIAEDKQIRQAEAERQHREIFALQARKLEQERKQRLIDSLSSAVKLLQGALEAFRDNNDERRCYVLLCKADPVFYTTKHQLNQTPERPTVTGLPTVKIKADNQLGYAIINSEDFVEGVHQPYEGTN
jgi:ribosomal protein S21